MKISCLAEPQEGISYPEFINIAKSCEEFGFHGLLLSDHFFLDFKSSKRICFETWTILTALAFQTEKLRLGTLVTCQSFRQPSLLAKIAATFDVVSNGRLEFGIGAGWKEMEYSAYGYSFPKAVTRARQLAESIQIIKKMWHEEFATFNGKYYQIRNAICFPKPKQKWPTIWIGALGEKLMFPIVAKYGDGVNFGFALKIEEYKRKLEVLEDHCKDIGRPFQSLRKSAVNYVFSENQSDKVEAYIQQRAQQRQVSYDIYRKRMEGAIWGNSDLIIESIQNYADLGVDTFIAVFPFITDLAAIRDFSDNIMPSFQ